LTDCDVVALNALVDAPEKLHHSAIETSQFVNETGDKLMSAH
jgi:hypothetical protein